MCFKLEVHSENFFFLVIFTSIDGLSTWFAWFVVCVVSHTTDKICRRQLVSVSTERFRYLQNGRNKQSNSPCGSFRVCVFSSSNTSKDSENIQWLSKCVFKSRWRNTDIALSVGFKALSSYFVHYLKDPSCVLLSYLLWQLCVSLSKMDKDVEKHLVFRVWA